MKDHNPYQTAEAHAVAEPNIILRVQVGSGLHGVTVKSQDDRDEMGICIEPPEYIAGLADFRMYKFRTQPEHHRSGPGDLDLDVYGLRKWAGLAAHGFSHRWDTKQADGRIEVSCILTHNLGHSESTTLEASPDSSGKKNAIQQVASTVTYLQRYTLLAACGLATKDMDK